MGKIVDFSHHQGDVDFKAAKADGLELAILRVQYGSSTIDTRYKEYVTACKTYKIPFGHYAYARFVSVDDAIKEAKDFIFRVDKQAKFLVVDVEELTTPKDQIVAATQAFIDVCKKAGWKVGLYTGHHFYKPYSMDKVKADFVWIPRYGDEKPDYPHDIWQYTESGKLDGVKGNVDLNRLSGRKPLSYFIGEPKKVDRFPFPGIQKEGSKSSHVKLIQSKLGIAADGIFGEKTEKAVKIWQKKHKLNPDGIVGKLTWKALFN